MACSTVRYISLSNVNRILTCYRSALTIQLRYYGVRRLPTIITSCRVISRERQRLLCVPADKFGSIVPPCSLVRWNSSSAGSSASQTVDSTAVPYIPEPPTPPVPDASSEVIEQLTALGEPTLNSLGLASLYPSGLVQRALEAIHVGIDLPWWATIVAGTLLLRLLIFPIVVLAQRQTVSMVNHMPVVQKMQEDLTKLRQSGDIIAASRVGMKLSAYTKEHKVNPIKNMLGPFVQIPIFISVFVGIRQMANLPVESMKTGGMWWFTDLTIPDPYYLMPICTMATMLATVELGADGITSGTMSKRMRYFMRALPVILMPFVANFPAAMLCYWLSANSISVVQVLILKIPQVRAFCKIPPVIKREPSTQVKKPLLKSLKETWKNSNVVTDVAQLQRMEATKFKEAGLGAVPKTYPYDPTKIQKVIAAKAAVKAKNA